jgi:hypothetical protein
LTVPVLLKGQGFPLIKDVVINSSVPWQRKHIKAIKQNYSKAPFYQVYAEDLFKILNKKWKYLIDLDVELIYWIVEELKIQTRFILSSDLAVSGSRAARLIDIILMLGGNHFYEGLAGRNYIDVSPFEEAGISVAFQDYKHPTYPQLYGDFISHLSVIDFLFNCGPDSLDILKNR